MSARKLRDDSPAHAVRSDSAATPVLPTRGAQTSAGNPSSAAVQKNPTTSTNRSAKGSMADRNKNQESVTSSTDASLNEQTEIIEYDFAKTFENGYKNPDHSRDENMGEIRVANPENSQNEVMTIDISNYDDQDENKNDIILISDDEDQDTLMDVDAMVNDGNEEVNDGKEEVDDGYEEVNDGNEEVNGGNEEINDNNEEVDDDDDEVNDPMNAVIRNAIAGIPSSAEFDCLSEEQQVQFFNNIYNERNYDDKEPKRIFGSTDVKGVLLFLSHWEGTEYAELVPSKIANIRWPMAVIQFYQNISNFEPPSRKE